MFTRLRLWFHLWKLRFRGSGTNPFLPPQIGEIRTRRSAAEDARILKGWFGTSDVKTVHKAIVQRISTTFDQGEEDENGFTVNFSNEWDSPRYRDEGEDPIELLHRRDFGAF